MAQETGDGATTTAPRMLSPRRLEPVAPPSPDEPRPESSIPSVPTAQPGPLPSDPDVQVAPLGTIDRDSVGTLSAENGGLGPDMWRGTPRRLVAELLPALPVGSSSAVMRSLARRLLLSTALAPEGEGEPGALIAVRARLLAEMGDIEGLQSLLDVIPQQARTPELLRVEASIRFLNNDNARACALAIRQIGQTEDPYWEKVFTFCQALAGDHDKAALGVSLLREIGVRDAVYYSLIDALGGTGTVTIDSMPDPTPLHLAMARAANVRLPADVIAPNRPIILRAVATSPNAPVELRLEAAERAESMGALPPEILRQLYTAISFSEEELANPLSRAETQSGPLSRALLYRASVGQMVPVAKAEAVARALELGRDGGRYISTARVFLPVLTQIPPSAELLWFAPEAVRALLAADEHGLAQSWFSVLRASALFNPESEAAVTSLGPVLHLASVDDAAQWNSGGLRDWWNAVRDDPDGREHGTLMFGLFDAFDEEVPAELWEDLVAESTQRVTIAAPRAAVWFRLRDAAANGRLGETVLLGLLAIGEGGPGQAAPVILHDVLRLLRAGGLEVEARRMAVEAALAAGA